MTLSEFKAWFEGFTEDMTGAPNKKQWDRIKARVGEITGQSVSYPVYIDRYVAPVRPYWERAVWGNTAGMAQGVSPQMAAAEAYNGARMTTADDGNNPLLMGKTFNTHSAMNAVGKADALALKAAA